MKNYPDKIKPIRHYNERDFSDRIPIFIKVSNLGYPIIETPSGRFKPNSELELLGFLYSHHNFFTYCSQGELQSLYAFLSRDQIYELSLMGNTSIYRNFPLAISIKVGGRTHVVWNIAPLLKVIPKTLDELNTLVDYLLGFYIDNKIPLKTLWSLGAIARNFFLSFPKVEQEIEVVRKLPKKLLQHFHYSCLGQRHETDRLGTEYQYHYDMIKAHLNVIEQIPSKSDLIVAKKLTYPEVVYGSYLAVVNIPELKKFSPACVRSDTKSYYIHGEIVSTFQKPQLDLMTKYGFKIKIIDSYELIGKPSYYTLEWAEAVRDILSKPGSDILSLGFLYNTIAGSSISTFESINKITGEIYWEGNEIYDPTLYGYTTGTVNSNILNLAYQLGENSRALRADEISSSVKLSPVPEGFKEKKSGETTYINNLLKSLPDGSTIDWNYYINKSRNKGYLEFPIHHTINLQSSIMFKKKPGVAHNFIRRVKPDHGYRLGQKPIKIGSLLDKVYPSVTSGIKEDYEESTWMQFIN